MSYKTLKRRLQRKKRAANLKWWADYRREEADRAFKDWKLVNEHLLEINRLEMRSGH